MERTSKKNKLKVYQLIGGKTPPTYILPSADKPSHRLFANDGSYRPIRYSSNQKSPFVEEQTGIIFERDPIIFDNGNLVVESSNDALIKFLAVSPGLDRIFELCDPEKQAAAELQQFNMEAEAMNFAKTADIDLLASAVRLLNEHSTAQTTSEIRRDAFVLARTNPEGLLSITTEPDFDRKNVAARAIEEQHLGVRDNGRSIYYNFTGNKKKLMSVPMDEEPIGALERYFLTDEGVELYVALKKLLEIE
jgi:hypothetical protein